MTTREIADAVNKTERTVQNWVARVSERNAEVADKSSVSNSTHPADYDLDETIAIIETGMGKNAAEIYRQNATYGRSNFAHGRSDVQVIDYMKLAEIIAATVGAVMDRAISRISAQQTRQLMLEAPISHMSLVGFIRSKGEKAPDIETLKRIGASLSARCRERGMTITKIPDERYGAVNGYPMEALEEYFTL